MVKNINHEVKAIWRQFEEEQERHGDEIVPIQKSFVRHAITTLARTVNNMDNEAAYQAIAHCVRDGIIQRWNATQLHHTKERVKRVYYLSLEFLMGRSLDNALLASQSQKEHYKEALVGLGFRLEDLLKEEVDAALGNGGLGRLAACFMDSLATLNYPAWGYGLRYTYGIFQQRIIDGYQHEFPDYWLQFVNAWEVPRPDVVYDVRFYGHTAQKDALGHSHSSMSSKTSYRREWIGGDLVRAMAYDVPIPGWATRNTINIRLWSSKPKKEFDLKSFNEGNYDQSVAEQQRAENITSVLYPNDSTQNGKELRLKQQYFFTSATLQDVIRRFKKLDIAWCEFPNYVAVQLNDTHPTLAIVELQRWFVDVEDLHWDIAWDIVRQTFSFTNHTVLPEAMEKWSVPLMKHLLPRHMEIIFDINLYFLQRVEIAYPNDRDILTRMSIIEEGQPQLVRMAHLAVVGSHTVNGVAEIHSKLIKETIFKDFVGYFGNEKFLNKTNGITPRRWLHQANPMLSSLISNTLQDDSWLRNLSLLKELAGHVDDPGFQRAWRSCKRAAKERLAAHVLRTCGVDIPVASMFVVQVKRIHEYKRQLMNILGVIHRYLLLKSMSKEERAAMVPRVILFGGKAAPGYYLAKLVIKLINSVANVINIDPDTHEQLMVIFIPDYKVSLAEIIIPASDISEHISTAGTEASGTSNMKFALNGGLIIGTLDGANIEIRDEIGPENMFIFGTKADKVDDIRHKQRFHGVVIPATLERVLGALRQGTFCDYTIIAPLIDQIENGDTYLLARDFDSYLDVQVNVDETFKDEARWTRMSILSTAHMGKFSSDRSIHDYAENIWHIQPCQVPDQ